MQQHQTAHQFQSKEKRKKEEGEEEGKKRGERRAIVSCLTFVLCSAALCLSFSVVCSVLTIYELFELLWRRYLTYACLSHCCYIFYKLPSSIIHNVRLWCMWVPLCPQNPNGPQLEERYLRKPSR